MSQHLVMFLIEDEDDDIKDSAALEEFAREVRGGFHESAMFSTFFQIGLVQEEQGESIMETVGDMIAQMQEDAEG